ncbi:PD40 domain-containing protein, partial [Vibrio cholerae O1]|nr:PD40 domain-containing protein [Vibrio cholerae O1]
MSDNGSCIVFIFLYKLFSSGKCYLVDVFSNDGKYLIFSSDRDFNPIYGSLEWNHVYTRTGGIYIAML